MDERDPVSRSAHSKIQLLPRRHQNTTTRRATGQVKGEKFPARSGNQRGKHPKKPRLHGAEKRGFGAHEIFCTRTRRQNCCKKATKPSRTSLKSRGSGPPTRADKSWSLWR